METTVKSVSTISKDMLYRILADRLEQVLTIYKFGEEVGIFKKEYLHEHPDEIDNVYTVIKCSNPSVSVIIERKKISYIKNREKLFNDQEQIFEAIVKRRLESGEDEILFRNILRYEEDEKQN